VPAGKGRAEHVRLEDFKAQEVSNVTHAFAKLGTYNTDVLEVMSSRHTLYLLQSMGNAIHGVSAVTCESAIVLSQHRACEGARC
jgi:tRNA pseudouridine-54 N-methylase